MLNNDPRNFTKGLFVSILAISSYWLFFSKYENRTITELSTKSLGKKILWGYQQVVVCKLLLFSVIYLYGGLKVTAANPVSILTIPFTVAFTIAILEEVLLSGIVFRITEEKWGSTIALISSGIIFVGLHLIDPHIDIGSMYSGCRGLTWCCLHVF